MSKNKQQDPQQTLKVENYEFEPIKGYPMLNWKGKRPFTSTQYFPAQLKESYGKPDANGWMNKIFWGDNLQVMSHLLKEYRGKVDLIYIDPPFDSKADYKKKIKLKGKNIFGDSSVYEEKQYTDIWANDEYLQFMYDRLVGLRELLCDTGSLYLHCDSNKAHYLRAICEEIFGPSNFRSEIIWRRSTPKGNMTRNYGASYDIILFFSKSDNFTWNQQYLAHSKEYIEKYYGSIEPETGRRYQLTSLLSPADNRPNLTYKFKGITKVWRYTKDKMEAMDKAGLIVVPKNGGVPREKSYLDEMKGTPLSDLWTDISPVNSQANDREDYPTQKPTALIERIINVSSKEGQIVFDCFVGSGTSLVAASNLNRKFIGADINLGAIRTSVQRLVSLEKQVSLQMFNVNNYDIFRNPSEAKEILISAFEISKITNSIFDGEKDGRMVKILPVNRIASKGDLNDLIAGFDYKSFERRQKENPNKPVEKILIVCMGHEPDLKAHLEKEVNYNLDVQIVDILRDKQDLQFKRESEAKVKIKKDKLRIEKFYPMNLLQKLSLQKEKVNDWKELVESVLIDWNYDGAVLEPQVIDIPEKNELVAGEYDVPKGAGTIRVKITDLLSESIEIEVGRE